MRRVQGFSPRVSSHSYAGTTSLKPNRRDVDLRPGVAFRTKALVVRHACLRGRDRGVCSIHAFQSPRARRDWVARRHRRRGCGCHRSSGLRLGRHKYDWPPAPRLVSDRGGVRVVGSRRGHLVLVRARPQCRGPLPVSRRSLLLACCPSHGGRRPVTRRAVWSRHPEP